MRVGLVVILAVVAYFIWKWWSERSVEKLDVTSPPVAPAAAPDPVPQGPGITMYGIDACPWCTKQKDYFKEKNIEYTYVNCSTGCPSFVVGYPTIVRDGRVMNGYQELQA